MRLCPGRSVKVATARSGTGQSRVTVLASVWDSQTLKPTLGARTEGAVTLGATRGKWGAGGHYDKLRLRPPAWARWPD